MKTVMAATASLALHAGGVAADCAWTVSPTDEVPPTTRLAAADDWRAGAPRLTGPAVFGATPGRRFDQAFPVCGARDGLGFGIDGELPQGVAFDSRRGVLSGRADAGEYRLRVTATNRLGRCSREVLFKVGDNCRALTPPMGWTSWNACMCTVDSTRIRKEAQALVDTGLAAHGWTYVNCDAGWSEDVGRPGVRRSPGPVKPNPAFADMADLVRDIHALGLKAGVYSSPMIYTWGSEGRHVFVGTGDYPVDRTYRLAYVPFGAETNGIGSVQRMREDAAQWATWGFDWLKYDWCSTTADLGSRMRAALDATGRDIVLQLCTACRPSESNVLARAAELVRGNDDVTDVWAGAKGLASIARKLDSWTGYSGPGRWYDLDMLAIGRMMIYRKTDGLELRPAEPLPGDARFDNRLTREEQILHFAYWAFAPAPLFLSCELVGLDGLVRDLASNDGLIAVNQDALGAPADFRDIDGVRVGSRPLSGGGRAWGAFNFADAPRRVTLKVDAAYRLTDAFTGRAPAEPSDAGTALSFVLPPHGARVFTGAADGRQAKREVLQLP